MSEEEEFYYTIFDKKRKMSPNDILRTKELTEELEQTESKISNLVNEYNNNYTQKEKEYLLKDLTFPINNDKIRKIGPVISKRVYQYLFSIN